MEYTREHELAHCFLWERLFDTPSPVVWAQAHMQPIDQQVAVLEEFAVQAFQRWCRAGEVPIIALDIPYGWIGLRDEFLTMAERLQGEWFNRD